MAIQMKVGGMACDTHRPRSGEKEVRLQWKGDLGWRE